MIRKPIDPLTLERYCQRYPLSRTAGLWAVTTETQPYPRLMARLGFDAEEWGQFTELCDEYLPNDAWCMELWPMRPDALAVYAGYGAAI